MNEAGPEEIVEFVSPVGFEATLARLLNAIQTAGLNLFFRFDHAANAREAGMAMPPATVLFYGNAKGGTPIMLEAPLAALDLPLRALVREREDGRTMIAFHPISAMLRRSGVSEALTTKLDRAQQILIEELAK